VFVHGKIAIIEVKVGTGVGRETGAGIRAGGKAGGAGLGTGAGARKSRKDIFGCSPALSEVAAVQLLETPHQRRSKSFSTLVTHSVSVVTLGRHSVCNPNVVIRVILARGTIQRQNYRDESHDRSIHW
jgi:hypothetical protein